MIHSTRIAVAALGSLLLSACVMTEQPLSDGESSRIDEQLIGVEWQEVLPPGETREPAVLEFSRHDSRKNAMQLVRRVAGEEPRFYTVYARPESPAILSIGLEDEEGKVSWLPMKYEIDEHGDFRMYGLDREVFCPAVADGKLKGTANRNDAGECVVVTLSSPPDEILKFIAEHSEKAWVEPLVYRRR